MTEPLRFEPRQNVGKESSELGDFLRVVRRALMMICSYIERRYGV